jgi:hypothetical protein
MTSRQRNGIAQNPFYAWMRAHADLDSNQFQLSAQDNDFWMHRFSIRNEKHRRKALIEHLQLIELKCFGADMSFAQRDTLNVVDLLLRKATDRRRGIEIADRRPRYAGCKRLVKWLGVHLVQLSGDQPDNSSRIRWDGKSIDRKTLIELLRFDRDPDHPDKFLDTRRHHVTEIYSQLKLFVL